MGEIREVPRVWEENNWPFKAAGLFRLILSAYQHLPCPPAFPEPPVLCTHISLHQNSEKCKNSISYVLSEFWYCPFWMENDILARTHLFLAIFPLSGFLVYKTTQFISCQNFCIKFIPNGHFFCVHVHVMKNFQNLKRRNRVHVSDTIFK